ncbi:patatin-like phospholipase family protein [Reinekea sp.]|jgi:NTE family protein|uniref:patatin-like phospholipase family protein n=1 Tax=Reinekea sp. TaxID=1970455 RepID=UPI00398A10AB
MSAERPYCLVLGGGGAKGVYHIGVWQALKELKIPVNAFIGNSIGAVIGAYLAQGAEKELMEIARSMKLSSLIRLNKDIALADENSLREHSLSYWQGVYRNLVDKRGLDTSPMRESLESTIDEDIIRENKLDFGVTTVNISDFKPRQVFIEQMEPGQLINYVMASAAFPGFENPMIEGKKYLDGGLFDNVPFTMAKQRGYRKIILVDISGIGLNRRPHTEGTQTVYIKNSIDIGNAFEFDPEFIKEFWHLGYLDTLHAFGKLDGYRYFIEPDSQAEIDWTLAVEPKLCPDMMRNDLRQRLKNLEICAYLLDVPRIVQYSYQSLTNAILSKIEETNVSVASSIAKYELDDSPRSSALIDALLKEMLDSKKHERNPYFYLKTIQHFKPTTPLTLAEKGLRKLHPELIVLEKFLEYISKGL